MKKAAYNIIVAGGGTGGHLFPGIAVAQALRGKNPENRILFLGTDRPVEKDIIFRAGFPHRSVRAEGLKGRRRMQQLRSLGKILPGIRESLGIFRSFPPDLLIGMGSYAAAAPLLAARMKGIKIMLHEQNRMAGLTNRVLSLWADRICVSFPLPQQKGFPAHVFPRMRMTGNPVREEILREKDRGTVKGGTPFRVLITGGSQGAHRINTAVEESLSYLKNKNAFCFVHQSGAADEASVRKMYSDAGISATVRAFFHNMAAQYRDADLLICRAGATSVAEICALGKAAVYIPFPCAADDHQTHNARALAEAGAAAMIPEKKLQGGKLAEIMEYYASHPGERERMAARARKFGNSNAAKQLAEMAYSLLEK